MQLFNSNKFGVVARTKCEFDIASIAKNIQIRNQFQQRALYFISFADKSLILVVIHTPYIIISVRYRDVNVKINVGLKANSIKS